MTCSSCGLRRRVGEETPVINELGEVIYIVLRCPLVDACAYVDSVEQPTSKLPVVAHAGQ